MGEAVRGALRVLRRYGVLAALLLAVGVLAGCSSPGSINTANATVVDVRTPSEFAAGHLQGAINIDVQSSDFLATIEAYPKDGTYILYCRSGSRAGTAMQQMKSAGFANVINAGGIDQASKSTGLPIVTT